MIKLHGRSSQTNKSSLRNKNYPKPMNLSRSKHELTHWANSILSEYLEKNKYSDTFMLAPRHFKTKNDELYNLIALEILYLNFLNLNLSKIRIFNLKLCHDLFNNLFVRTFPRKSQEKKKICENSGLKILIS